MRAGSFRNSVLGERKPNQSKGWKGGFRDRLDIPKDEATPILLLSADYEDPRGTGEVLAYYPHDVHSLKLAASGPGSYREVPCAGEKCVGCYAQSGRDPRVTKRTKFALNVMHLSLYKKEQAKDKDGKPVVYSEDGKEHRRGDAVMTWNEIVGRKDRRDAEANIDRGVADGTLAMFRRKYLDVGKNHLDHLMAIDEAAGKLCFCGGGLAPTAFHCNKCDHLLCDVENSNLTAKQVNEFSTSRQRCSHCGHIAHPKVITICDNCDQPSPMSVFDVVAYVRKHGEATASTVIIEKIVPLTEFMLPNGEALVKDWNVTDEGIAPVWSDRVANMMTPFDFEQVFGTPESSYVSALLGIQDPYGTGEPASRPYGGGGGGGANNGANARARFGR